MSTVILSEIAVVVCTVLAGAVAVPLINWLKDTVKIKGAPMNRHLILLLAFIVSSLLGFLAAWMVGDMVFSVPLTPEGFRAALMTAFGFATLIYKLTKQDAIPDDQPPTYPS